MTTNIRYFGLLLGLGLASLSYGQPLASFENQSPPTREQEPRMGNEPTPMGPATVSKADAKKGAVIAITVGQNKIRHRQIDTLVDLMVRAKRTSGSLDPREKASLERMVATNLIGQELLALEAQRLNVVAPDREIDSLSKLFKSNFPDDAAFKRALTQAGDTEKGLREKMIRQIKADKLLNSQLTAVSKPTEKDILDFFNTHKKEFPFNDSLRACQIVLTTSKSASAEEVAKKKSDLERVRVALAKDSSDVDMLLTHFVMAAQQVSDGPEKKDGGDLQRFHPNDFNPAFKKQVVTLNVGQMSPVFRSPVGWHLVLLTERFDGKFSSYRLQISRLLAAEKAAVAGKNLKKYLQTLAARYKVNYLEAGLKDTSMAGVYNL